MENDNNTVQGIVSSILFHNPENEYTVLKIRDSGEEGNVTVTGCMPGIAVGEQFYAEGSWVVHGSYGRQFKASRVERKPPDTTENIYAYLASGVIKGVGSKTARLLVQRFGKDTLRVLDETPEKVYSVSGIPKKRAEEIIAQYREQNGFRKLMDFMAEKGVPAFAAARLYRIYNDDAKEELLNNPYILAEPEIGLTFNEADSLAVRINYDMNSPERIAAATLYELRYNCSNGHVMIPDNRLIEMTTRFAGITADAVREGIENLSDGGYIKRDILSNIRVCYPDDLYEHEVFTAQRIVQMAMSKVERVSDTDKAVALAESSCGINFADKQKKALEIALNAPIMILTGGPGTGKTTTVKGILRIFDHIGLKTLLAAPTGRAAKRLSELTGREAQTVHRLLCAEMSDDVFRTSEFQKCASDPLKCGALILDETSMMDITLMYSLLDALPKDARLVLVGDADQLPSVGSGNVFEDIIKSGIVPVVALTEVFRQASESAIIINAHRIIRGEISVPQNGGNMYFLQRDDAESVVETVTDLVARRLPNNMGIPSSDIQVLCPTRRTNAGTEKLNVSLQEKLNKSQKSKTERRTANGVFRQGDRVMQTRNNYDLLWYRCPSGIRIDFSEDAEKNAAKSYEQGKGVYNGDIGYIDYFDTDRETVMIRYDDRLVPYNYEQLIDLELAYAVTVHKAQGSEYRAVVLALPDLPKGLESRSVLYTAVTRARELLVIVGKKSTYMAMIRNDKRQKRYSGLRLRLLNE